MPEEQAQQGALAWDTNTAAGLIVLGALAFLFVVRRGFRGVVVSVGN